jgi:hypothetical protein
VPLEAVGVAELAHTPDAVVLSGRRPGTARMEAMSSSFGPSPLTPLDRLLVDSIDGSMRADQSARMIRAICWVNIVSALVLGIVAIIAGTSDRVEGWAAAAFTAAVVSSSMISSAVLWGVASVVETGGKRLRLQAALVDDDNE